jgi:sulfate adenylyltransferase
MIAVLRVAETWRPDRSAEARAVLGTEDPAHPGVAHLLSRSNPVYVGGEVEGVERPRHYDFRPLRLTPAELRAEFARLGWRKVIAFQTRNPMHRAHHGCPAGGRRGEANLLVHPVVGLTKPGTSTTMSASVP